MTYGDRQISVVLVFRLPLQPVTLGLDFGLGLLGLGLEANVIGLGFDRADQGVGLAAFGLGLGLAMPGLGLGLLPCGLTFPVCTVPYKHAGISIQKNCDSLVIERTA